MVACKSSDTLWAIECKSPDKTIVIDARTEQYSGFGTAGVYTSAYIKKGGRSEQILLLENQTAYPKGVTNLDIKWVSSSKVVIKYRGPAKLEFRELHAFGVDINIENS
jgi:hypothetical protein